ncbi:MAG: DUF1553 domain-containing protein [Planctomycetota bacterium]
MKRALPAYWILMAALSAPGVEPGIIQPFEQEAKFISANPIDDHVLTLLRKRGIEPANPCSDAVFFRRVHLDVIGTLPEPKAVVAFLQDRNPNKRATVINDLLKRNEFADYWSMKWCDLLRVKAEFPINLWPNAVQAYHRWIHDQIRENCPYDQFARDLLTSSGSNFRVPPVNFYRAVQRREPDAIAEAVALTFMGTRVSSWPEARRAGMAAFFTRIAYKGTAEWKEEIVCLNPAPSDSLKAVFPDGTSVQIAPGEDPRKVFADWLITPTNPWFARNIVNRVWAWLMGRGITHEPDDIQPDNPPVNPELLAYLEKELVNAKYDLRHIYRLILNSRTYQQSPIPRSNDPQAEAMFACYPVRQLDAEVLIDALNWISGTGEGYSSMIPEPFTFIPESQPSISLADGSITSQFLEMFGRPPRDTGLESERACKPTAKQRLHLLNATHVQEKLQRSRRLTGLVQAVEGKWKGKGKGNDKANHKGKNLGIIRWIYLTILSRDPMPAELTAAENYFKTGGLKQGAEDLAWALINTKEFLYRH